MHSIKREQLFSAGIDEVWNFISSPANLQLITPPEMSFKIENIAELPETIYQGQVIQYTLRPLSGLKLKWVTEITHVKPKEFFVDEQRVGPYKLWHHQHLLLETNEGTRMMDLVHYQLHLGLVGKITNELLIKKKLAEIFNYRFKKLDELFNSEK